VNFTPQETKLLQRLRKRERQWRWVRWLMLVVGVFCVGLCGAFGFLLHLFIPAFSDHGAINANMLLLILVIWTQCCLHLVLGILFIATVILDWHGNVNRVFLLKLLDAQEKGV